VFRTRRSSVAPHLSPFAPALRDGDVVIPLTAAFRFAHEPLPADAPSWFVGREADLDALTQRLLFSEGGSYLVTGYRGVGKTSFVNQVIRRLEEALPWARTVLGDVEVLHVQLTLARRLEPAELMHHVVRRLYESLAQRGLLAQLPQSYRSDLSLAYRRTSFNVTQKRGVSSERSFGIPEMKLGFGSIEATTKGLFSQKSVRTGNEEASFLSYDDRAAEQDVISLSRVLARGLPRRSSLFERLRRSLRRQPAPTIRFKIIFVFDELDKLDDAPAAAENGKPRSSIDELIGFLKTLFTTSGISFVFIAGKDLHERWLEDIGKGDSIYESVFAYDKYLPCLWGKGDSLFDPLLDSAAIAGFDSSNQQTAHALLRDFKQYLAFVGRGIPRRMIRGFNEHVYWHGERPVLVLGRQDARRIRFFARLQEVLDENDKRFVGEMAEDAAGAQYDQRRLIVYYLIDWILRRRSSEFTFEEALQATSLFSSKIAPAADAAPVVVRDLIGTLRETDYIEEIAPKTDQARIGDPVDGGQTRYRVLPRRLLEIGDEARPFEPDFSPPSEAQPGPNDARFVANGTIGRGGMATVYRALDRETGRIVALKVLPKYLAATPGFLDRFRREADVLGQLRHPRIVGLLAVGEVDGEPFIAMDYVEGLDLSVLLRRTGRLALDVALAIARDAAEAIAFAHSTGFARLDVKPSNILLSKDGRAVLSDLGLTKRVESAQTPDVGLTRVGEFVGTPAYMAPEQAQGGALDGRADIYSFGVVLYEMFSGSPPFTEDDPVRLMLAHVQRRPPPLDQIVDLPGSIVAMVMKCLEKEPEERFRDEGEILAIIDAQLRATGDELFERRHTRVAEVVAAALLSIERERGEEKHGTEVLVSASRAGEAAQPQEPPSLPRPANSIRVTVRPSRDVTYVQRTEDFAASSVTIGRSRDCDLVLDGDGVSRYHAKLVRRRGELFIEDLNSANGTFVGGRPAQGEVPVRDVDVVQIGEFLIRMSVS
jgi:serine/threonine protein kinase